jgi:hypothetical protein
MKKFSLVLMFLVALTATMFSQTIEGTVTTKALPKGTTSLYLFSTIKTHWKVNGGVDTDKGTYFDGVAKSKEYWNFCSPIPYGYVLIIGIFDADNRIISKTMYGHESAVPTSFVLQSGTKFSAILRDRVITDKPK